jgi:hypothetical protein
MPSCSSEFTPRWTGDIAAHVLTTRDTINDWEFRNGIYVADHYDDNVLKPIYLYMERPNTSGTGGPQQLHLLACRKVPVGAEQVCGAGHMATQHLHMTHRNTNSLQRQAPQKEFNKLKKTFRIFIEPCKFPPHPCKGPCLAPICSSGHGPEQVPATQRTARRHDGPSRSPNLAAEGEWYLRLGRRRDLPPPGMRARGTGSVPLTHVMSVWFAM